MSMCTASCQTPIHVSQKNDTKYRSQIESGLPGTVVTINAEDDD